MGKIYMTGGGGSADLDVVTAGAGDVLAGKVIVDKDGNPLTGTMANRGAVNQSLAINGSYTIPQGYHSGSGKVSQSVPTQEAKTITPGANQQQVAAGRYLTGAITVPGFSMPAANLIKKGAVITIYGRSVTGTFEGYVATATDLYNNGLNPGGFQNPLASNYGIVFESNMIRTTSGSTNYCTLKTDKKYNFTPYSRINIEFMASRGTSGFAVGYTTSETNPMNANNVDGSDKSWSLDRRVTVSQDISAYQGEAYVVIGEIFGYIYRVWFS